MQKKKHEPKNSLIKQYEKLFELDGIKITFSESKEFPF